jgi:hypothetical protein
LPNRQRKLWLFLKDHVFHKSRKILALGESVERDLNENCGVSAEKIFVYGFKSLKFPILMLHLILSLPSVE